MDWRSITFDWNRARAFLVTAEEGSFSAAARALNLSQPTLGRQVAALEAELGLTLFDRPGGGLALTEAGQELLGHLRDMGEAANRLSLVASGQVQSVEGHVRISASELAAVYLLPPVLEGLRADHPGITLEVVSTDSISDLARREADIALRNADPGNPDLIARRLPDEGGTFFASDAWLANNEAPKTIEDFRHVDLVGLDDSDRMIQFMQERGLPVQIENVKVQSSSHVAHWAMAQAGLGLGLASFQIGALTPGMHVAAPWLDPITFPVWLVAHRDLLRNRRIRIVFDRLAEEFRRTTS